jgi:hypothetical protein
MVEEMLRQSRRYDRTMHRIVCDTAGRLANMDTTRIVWQDANILQVGACELKH